MEQKRVPIWLRFSKNYMEMSIAIVGDQIEFYGAAFLVASYSVKNTNGKMWVNIRKWYIFYL